MSTTLDKFYVTLSEFLDLLAELVDDLHGAGQSPVDGSEIRTTMFLLECYGKELSVIDFLNSSSLWKDFYKKEAASLSLDFAKLLGIKEGLKSFHIPMNVYNKDPQGEIMNGETIEDIFSFLIPLVGHALTYEEESRKKVVEVEDKKKVVEPRSQIDITQTRKQFNL